jgi:stage III sporulation protein SpoIIIAA
MQKKIISLQQNQHQLRQEKTFQVYQNSNSALIIGHPVCAKTGALQGEMREKITNTHHQNHFQK